MSHRGGGVIEGGVSSSLLLLLHLLASALWCCCYNLHCTAATAPDDIVLPDPHPHLT